MRTEKFNRPFIKDQVLSHTELNDITDAVDDVIDVLSSLDEGDHTLTDAQIEAEIKSRTDQIKDQIDADVADLNNVIDLLSSNLEGTASDLVKAKNAIGLIVQSNENGDSIKRAAIVAAINEDGSSIAGILADKIVLDGNVTTSGTLTTLDAEIANIRAAKADIASLDALQATISNLNVPTEALITNAVINKIEAGNVTITGTLQYNLAIGNVQIISQDTGNITLPDNSYFVLINGSESEDPSAWPIIKLPENPVRGLILFIDLGTSRWFLEADQTIRYYRLDYDYLQTPHYSISVHVTGDELGTRVNPSLALWDGVVLFIYTGGYWHQIVHNIVIPS